MLVTLSNHFRTMSVGQPLQILDVFSKKIQFTFEPCNLPFIRQLCSSSYFLLSSIWISCSEWESYVSSTSSTRTKKLLLLLWYLCVLCLGCLPYMFTIFRIKCISLNDTTTSSMSTMATSLLLLPLWVSLRWYYKNHQF